MSTLLNEDERHAATDRPNKTPGLDRIADLAVHLDGSGHDAPRLAHAQMLASIFGTHVEGFFANPIPTSFIPVGAGYERVAAELWEEGRAAGDETEKAILAHLDRMGNGCSLRRIDGMPHELAFAAGRLARTLDLFILGRPDDDRSLADLIAAVLFDAGSPALIVPPEAAEARDPQTIVVAWRDTTECSRAIAAALPFLKRAREVFLVSVAEGTASEERHSEPAADMARHLARHGVNVEVRHLPKWNRPADALLNEAKIVGAELLVSGAYGRSRLREMILGGVTRDLLKSCPIPLLMSH
ncbi:MAG TPA: universal stress protein [Aurantimonas sp.]|jgi:nucleotide-binding universal stress UspA family protein|nr:universal stress protein [Aurantimonas sp.]